MEPAPLPSAPAAGPGASPRRFRSTRPSHGARAGHWGAPRPGLAVPHVPVPQPQRTRRERGRPGTPCGRRLRLSTDAQDARAELGWPHRSPQPATRSPQQPRGSAKSAPEAAAEVAECAPPLAPAAAAAAPLRQPRRVPAAAASGRCPRPPGSRTGFPGWAGAAASPACPHWAEGGTPRASWDPKPLHPGFFLSAGDSDPLLQTRTPSPPSE